MQKRLVFSFDKILKIKRGREFQITGLMYLKDLSPRILLPIPGAQDIEG